MVEVAVVAENAVAVIKAVVAEVKIFLIKILVAVEDHLEEVAQITAAVEEDRTSKALLTVEKRKNLKIGVIFEN